MLDISRNSRLPFKLKTKQRWHKKWIKLTVETMVKDFFSIRETSCNLRVNVVNLCVPKFNLNFTRNSFTYKCAQLWNKLPEGVKLADNVNIFS